MRRASKRKARFAAQSQPDLTNNEHEGRVFASGKREGAAQRTRKSTTRPSRSIAKRTEKWLRSRADCLLVGVFFAIMACVAVPSSHVSAVITIALLAVARTAFQAVASIGVASASRNRRH